MPNWIANKLYIIGPAQDIAEFKAKSRDLYFPTKEERAGNHQPVKKRSKPVVVDLSFDRMVPVPLAVKKKPYIKLGNNCFEDPIIPWCRKHWGCKWDAYYPELVRESKRRLFYCFSTPWDPPFEWLRRVSKQFPQLRFSLHYWDDSYDRWALVRALKGHLKFKKTS